MSGAEGNASGWKWGVGVVLTVVGLAAGSAGTSVLSVGRQAEKLLQAETKNGEQDGCLRAVENVLTQIRIDQARTAEQLKQVNEQLGRIQQTLDKRP